MHENNNRTFTLVYNKGINDLPRGSVSHKGKNHTFYSVWQKMLERCYSDKYQTQPKNRNYIGCTVCDEWLLLSSFKQWFDIHHIEGWHLDKDMKVKGNKVYSPDTCTYIPEEVNKFHTNNRFSGVSLWKGKWRAQMGIGGGNKKALGLFLNYEDAKEAYDAAKAIRLNELLLKYNIGE